MPMTKAEYNRRYREKHKEKIIAYRKAYYAANTEKAIASATTYYEDNRSGITTALVQARTDNKKKAVEMLGGKCAMCGGVFDPCVYDFHHKDPKEKEVGLAKLMHRTWDLIEKELVKCVLLCSNCHRVLHHRKDQIDDQ